MHARFLLGLVLLALLAASPGQAVAQTPATTSCPDVDLQPTLENLPIVESAMVCLMNEARRDAGRAGLTVDARLEESAGFHTREMAERQFFAHHRGGGPSLVQRVRDARYFDGVPTALYSENLGYGPEPVGTARELVAAWMQSDRHRVNILHQLLTDVGIGSAIVGPGPAFWPDRSSALYTVDFGRRYPAAKAPASRRRTTSRRRCLRRGARTGPSPGAATSPGRYCTKRRTTTRPRSRR